MSLHDYLIDHRGLDWRSLLAEWRWLVPKQFTIWLMNRFGDLFVVVEDGSIHMLDIGAGTLKQVVTSRDDFGAKIDEDDNADYWLMIPLIDALVAAGITLREGECYSYKRPPVIGGDYAVDNTCVLPIGEHFGMYGSIHNQIKDIPDGSPVVIEVKK